MDTIDHRTVAISRWLRELDYCESWAVVPGSVSRIYKEAAPAVSLIRRAIKDLPADPGYGYVFWHPKKQSAWVVLGDGDDQAHHNRWKTKLQSIGISDIRSESEGHPPDIENWIQVKKAAPLDFIGKPWSAVTGAMGGPNAMATTIAGGLLGGGLGYGAGALAEHLIPEQYLERGTLRKRLGLLGAGMGAVPGLWQGSANHRNSEAAGAPLNWMQSFTTTSGQIPLRPEFQNATKALGDIKLDPSFNKLAEQIFGAGAMDLPVVPVDAFNRAVWNDVRRGAARDNPYGTQDPWGTTQQTMHTPPALGAATTGIMSGIQAMHGGAAILTPAAVVRGIASAGVGLATANLAGKTLSALAGLTPAAQDSLQSMGAWVGLLNAVVPPLFGR